MERIGWLWSLANMNAALIQSYRQIQVKLQSILLAIGVGLLVVALRMDNVSTVLVIDVVYTGIAVVSLTALKGIQVTIITRGRDVSEIHRRLILEESDMELADRIMTKFKIEEQARRSANPKEYRDLKNDLFMRTDTVITEEDTVQLVEVEPRYTRRIVDNVIARNLRWVWLLLSLGIVFATCRFIS